MTKILLSFNAAMLLNYFQFHEKLKKKYVQRIVLRDKLIGIEKSQPHF
jgi:hypothetical protein